MLFIINFVARFPNFKFILFQIFISSKFNLARNYFTFATLSSISTMHSVATEDKIRPPEASASVILTFQGDEEKEATTTLSAIFKKPQTTCAGPAESHKISPSSNPPIEEASAPRRSSRRLLSVKRVDMRDKSVDDEEEEEEVREDDSHDDKDAWVPIEEDKFVDDEEEREDDSHVRPSPKRLFQQSKVKNTRPGIPSRRTKHFPI